ncbi:hypothetical protein HDV00_006536 [Rhizophlyctis rosea]|nr:hypothetical protein HDV00_006536 [Rhizophlyctis rosea]
MSLTTLEQGITRYKHHFWRLSGEAVAQQAAQRDLNSGPLTEYEGDPAAVVDAVLRDLHADIPHPSSFSNPLLDNVYIPWAKSSRRHRLSTRSLARQAATEVFAWAIPTYYSLQKIHEACSQGIGEIGAGTGYRAHLLSLVGADVLATDNYRETQLTYNIDDYTIYDDWGSLAPPNKQLNESKPLYHPVQNIEGNAFISSGQAGTRVLLFCWPREEFGAQDGFRGYNGDCVVCVGEGSDGCTADIGGALKGTAEWEMDEMIDIPQWEGIHDYISIWRRI